MKATQPINRAEHVYLRKRFLDCADVFLKGSKTERELFTKIGSTLDPDEVSRLIAIKTGHCLTEGPNLFFEYFSDSERKELCLRFIEWCLLQREEERERKKARRRAAVAKEGGAVPVPGAPVGAVGHGPGRSRVPGGVTGTARHDHPDPPGGRGDHGEQVKKGAEPGPAVQPPKREKRQVLTFAELEARHELELLELELNLKEKQEKKERLMAQLQRVTQEDIIKKAERLQVKKREVLLRMGRKKQAEDVKMLEREQQYEQKLARAAFLRKEISVMRKEASIESMSPAARGAQPRTTTRPRTGRPRQSPALLRRESETTLLQRLRKLKHPRPGSAPVHHDPILPESLLQTEDRKVLFPSSGSGKSLRMMLQYQAERITCSKAGIHVAHKA